jgi:hypothetical protein
MKIVKNVSLRLRIMLSTLTTWTKSTGTSSPQPTLTGRSSSSESIDLTVTLSLNFSIETCNNLNQIVYVKDSLNLGILNFYSNVQKTAGTGTVVQFRSLICSGKYGLDRLLTALGM